MEKYSVSATVNIDVEFEVEANSIEEAYEIAECENYSIEQWGSGITEFKSFGHFSNNIQVVEI